MVLFLNNKGFWPIVVSIGNKSSLSSLFFRFLLDCMR